MMPTHLSRYVIAQCDPGAARNFLCLALKLIYNVFTTSHVSTPPLPFACSCGSAYLDHASAI